MHLPAGITDRRISLEGGEVTYFRARTLTWGIALRYNINTSSTLAISAIVENMSGFIVFRVNTRLLTINNRKVIRELLGLSLPEPSCVMMII